MYEIDCSQTTTNTDSFNVITTPSGQSSAIESPLGILICVAAARTKLK